MKKHILILSIILFTTIAVNTFSQTELRYFDSAEADDPSLTISILYPSAGTIRSIVALRDEELFPRENVTVVGVYHVDEFTNYRASQRYVRENELSWFKFHEIRGELSEATLFQKNTCSGDFAAIFAQSDGIIFFGGADITPSIYGSKISLFTKLGTPHRHNLENSFIFHLLGGLQDKQYRGLLESEPTFPILAICLGSQTLNVGTGGTLVQDIWDEIYGKKYYEDVIAMGREAWHTNPLSSITPRGDLLSYNLHRIKFHRNSNFIREIGYDAEVQPFIMSAHHQNMKKLGKDIVATAKSLDGKVIELLEHKRFPNVLGTQFHPDFTILWDADYRFKIAPEDAETSVKAFMENHPPSFEFNRRIWKWFIGKAQEFDEKK